MPDPVDERREAILAAAQLQFGRYGFRRTSMEDIAKETGVSRASLYSYFDNKEEIFRSLTALLHEQSLEAAERCLKDGPTDAGIGPRVEAALLARMTPFLEIVMQSAHGSEISDENNRLCGELVVASSERFLTMLSNALAAAARAGEIDLESADLSADAAAELIHRSAAGLKQGAPEIATVERRLHGFLRVFFAGLGA